ncbi:hypothetical protein [Desulfurobacterium sp. TC5-1]|uniref:hypothetical protein n=1 Tax=Desulfurobacterium sp. TC5-1 TaxID=1158318 RepID=UPI0003B3828E|nr:hypothetical protein [Desulfurobacterium sp. TC5-1]
MRKLKIVIPANFREYEVEINPDDYVISIWKADPNLPYKPACEGLIKGVKNPDANVPEIVKEILKFSGEVAFFTREMYPELCQRGADGS